MGYRTYIYSMPKREYNKIKSMTKDELVEFYKVKRDDFDIEEGYLGLSVYNFGKELYEFGKYTDFDPPKKSMKNFFKNKETNLYFTEEHDFCVVTPEFLEYIIGSYKEKISTYYNEMVNPFLGIKDGILDRDKPSEFLNSIKTDYSSRDYNNYNSTFDFTKITQEEQNALVKIIQHVRDMRVEWTCLTPYKLNDGTEAVTSSWKYEYGIFELVRIYKSFDWKKNVMYFAGW
jgi:hypothetical protein